MGCPRTQAYLVSPAIVAASVVKGYIYDRDSLDLNALPKTVHPTFSLSNTEPSAPVKSSAEVESPLLGFPPTSRGPLLFVPQDNLNADGMCPGKYTYQDDITLESKRKS